MWLSYGSTPGQEPFNQNFGASVFPTTDFSLQHISPSSFDHQQTLAPAPVPGPGPQISYPQASVSDNELANPPSAPPESSVSNGPFVCNICGKGYAHRYELNKHKKYHNKTCLAGAPGCPGVGGELKDLYRHLWVRHPDFARENNIPQERGRCEVCGYSSIRLDNLVRHKRMKRH
ncbi:hypothetical protein QBC42DRAFT_45754 [Cladorrhinum samala]|uniref:C2H2-type domain-containing protein n=1 Tax=Cladorrhinum samala TaxID=585594 RepID=A0AAV9HY37_9PEZI|nr:hypothetical protein QBC42DRAFT_45754 [Cladorrhinum samala]